MVKSSSDGFLILMPSAAASPFVIEDEGHPEHTFPEINRALPVRAGQRDVMNALGLDLAHLRPPYHVCP